MQPDTMKGLKKFETALTPGPNREAGKAIGERRTEVGLARPSHLSKPAAFLSCGKIEKLRQAKAER